jgi:hypothetical protein
MGNKQTFMLPRVHPFFPALTAGGAGVEKRTENDRLCLGEIMFNVYDVIRC